MPVIGKISTDNTIKHAGLQVLAEVARLSHLVLLERLLAVAAPLGRPLQVVAV